MKFMKQIYLFLFFMTCEANYLQCFDNINFENLNNISSIRNVCEISLKSTCTKNITVTYLEMVPYSKNHNDNKTMGMLHQIFLNVLNTCCGSCLNIEYKNVSSRHELNRIIENQESDISLPVYINHRHCKTKTHESMFVPMIELENLVLISKSKLSPSIFVKDVLKAIFDIAPLFGISLILALVAGGIIWILDTRRNEEELPKQFFKGTFEGFWWAVVSMTTVGYGDISPKSILGRIFAVFWIFCGLTIVSLTTAALTTAITEVAKKQKVTISKNNVGVLKGHMFEKHVARKNNAKSVAENNIMELMNLLETSEIDAILMDTISARYYHEYLDTNIMELTYESKTINNGPSYLGINVKDVQLHYLLSKYLELFYDAVEENLLNKGKIFNSEIINAVKANQMFTTDSGLFVPFMILGFICIFLMFATGGIYEAYKHYKEQKKRNVSIASTITEEHRLEDDLESLMSSWQDKLQSKLKTYAIIGNFNMNSSSKKSLSVKIIPGEKYYDEFNGDTVKLKYSSLRSFSNTTYMEGDISRDTSTIYHD